MLHMKTIQSVLVITFVLLSVHTISAQYGNGGYNNGYGNGNGYGGNRRMNSGMDQARTPEKPKEIPVEVSVAKIMETIKPELNLDELQVVAMSNIFIESFRTQGMLLKAETSQEDKIKNIEALSEVTDRKLMALLNEDQKEKFIILKKEQKNPKKSKSKKKSK